MHTEERKAYIELHIAVILFGFTAILGELIQLPALSLVWWRVCITCISLLYFINWGQKLRIVSRKNLWRYMGIGLIVGLHWLTFYGSIKMSNASMALVCLATTSFFTSIIESLVGKRSISRLELLLGALILPGMYIIFHNIDPSMVNGFLVGIISAICAATFATLNKVMIGRADNYTITFIELGSAWILMSVLLLLGIGNISLDRFFPPTTMDWVYIIVLALLCTTLAYVLALNALKHLSAFASNLVINIEPIYGIVLAAILLKEHEQLNTSFYIGGGMILATVLAYPYLKKRYS